MPTVLTWKGLRVVIYFNDHRPAHVHVIGGGCEAVFRLDCPSGPAKVRENYGFSRSMVNSMEGMLTAHTGELCAEWKRMHGDF